MPDAKKSIWEVLCSLNYRGDPRQLRKSSPHSQGKPGRPMEAHLPLIAEKMPGTHERMGAYRSAHFAVSGVCARDDNPDRESFLSTIKGSPGPGRPLIPPYPCSSPVSTGFPHGLVVQNSGAGGFLPAVLPRPTLMEGTADPV